MRAVLFRQTTKAGKATDQVGMPIYWGLNQIQVSGTNDMVRHDEKT